MLTPTNQHQRPPPQRLYNDSTLYSDSTATLQRLYNASEGPDAQHAQQKSNFTPCDNTTQCNRQPAHTQLGASSSKQCETLAQTNNLGAVWHKINTAGEAESNADGQTFQVLAVEGGARVCGCVGVCVCVCMCIDREKNMERKRERENVKVVTYLVVCRVLYTEVKHT